MEARPLLRDNETFSRTDIKGGQMHPSGVQFGLSRGLLELRGGEVLLSDQLLETISAEVQRHLQLGNPPIRGNLLVDITVRAAQDALGTQDQGRREAIVPFFANLNRTMYHTLCRVAERAGLAHKEPAKLLTNPDFWRNSARKRWTLTLNPAGAWRRFKKALFKICHRIGKERYAKNDTDNIRHAGSDRLIYVQLLGTQPVCCQWPRPS
jgi:hypothetical protein